MPKRAVLYARVSGDDRHTEGRNLAGQLDQGRAYAAEHGYTVVAELAEDDRGASGAAFELPMLNRVRELAAARAFDVLVVRELDRLSRSLAKQLFVEEELKRGRVEIEYVSGAYPDTPEGNLLKHIRASVAEFERLKITERMLRGRLQAVAAGSVLAHGRPPFGYRSVREGPLYCLVIDPADAATVRLIFDLYLHGAAGGPPLNAYQVAEVLSARQIPAAADRDPAIRRKRPGGWNAASVTRILSRETYAGTWHYRKFGLQRDPDGKERHLTRPRAEWLAVEVPAIIDRATWAAACARRLANTYTARRHLLSPERYLVRGRVRCGTCGVRMQGISPSQAKPYAYYRCPATATHSNYAVRCSARLFRTDAVDATVWRWLRGLLLDPAALSAGLTELQARQAAAAQPLTAALAETAQAIADVARQSERLLDVYLAGELAREPFTQRQALLREREAALRLTQQDLQARLTAVVTPTEPTGDTLGAAAEIALRLPAREQDWRFRRYVIERLDVQVELSGTGRAKVAAMTCVIGAVHCAAVHSCTAVQ